MHKVKMAADTSLKYRLQLCLCESLIAGCLDNNCMTDGTCWLCSPCNDARTHCVLPILS